MKGPFMTTIAAIAAVSFVLLAGCNKDNGHGKDTAGEQEALLNISFVNPVHTRVAGPKPTTDTEIIHFSVFVTDNNDEIIWKEHVTGDELVNFPVTTYAKKVYVIANSMDYTSLPLTMLEELEALRGRALATEHTDSRTASGFEDIVFDNNNVANVEVTMQFVTARIAVTVDNQLEGYTGEKGDGTLVIDEIFLLNARGKSMMFGGEGVSLIPTLPTGDDEIYTNGVNMSLRQEYLYTPDESLYNHGLYLNNPYTPPVNPATTTDYHFYVYEGPVPDKPEDLPLIVTIKGTNGEGENVFFPVHFASYETFTSGELDIEQGIRRGHSYDLTITLTGNAKDPLGIDDPTKPIINAKVSATLEIEEWVAVPLVKEF